MIAPPEGVCEVGGHVFHIRPPHKAIDVLEADVFLVASTRDGAVTPKTRVLRAIQSWCAEHVVRVEVGPESGEREPKAVSEYRQFIDNQLSYQELTRLRLAIIDLGSMPQETLRQVREFWYVARSGGCECPVCESRVDATVENQAQYKCLYGQFDPSIDRIVNATHSIGDSSMLDAPWWLYQLQQAQSSGTSRAIVEERKNRKRSKSSTNVLKNRGYLQ